jgi:hypothetical protein
MRRRGWLWNSRRTDVLKKKELTAKKESGGKLSP